VQDLADKLRRLAGDPQLAASLGKAAYRNYWANPCTLGRHVTELAACYLRILES